MANQESKGAYLQWLFLSAEGRLPRSPYWAASIALLVPFLIIFGILGALGGKASSGGPQSFTLLMFYLLFLLASVSLGIKRLHDCNMSGAWLFVSFLPYIGPLFMLIVAGCSPGTKGSNEYGKDPLALDAESPNSQTVAESASSRPGEGPI